MNKIPECNRGVFNLLKCALAELLLPTVAQSLTFLRDEQLLQAHPQKFNRLVPFNMKICPYFVCFFFNQKICTSCYF